MRKRRKLLFLTGSSFMLTWLGLWMAIWIATHGALVMGN